MDANEKKEGQKPEVYKIVTLGQGNVNRREFVKSVAVATGVAVVAMGADKSDAQAQNRAGAAVNLLLLDDAGDPCSSGCQCHMVCACESVGTCVCDDVRSTCHQGSTGQSEIYDHVQQLNGSVCTCNRVAVCTCDTVCTCNVMCTCQTVCTCQAVCTCQTVCTCQGVCSCQSVCSCVGNHYWYPC